MTTATPLRRGTTVRIFWIADAGDSRTLVLRVQSDDGQTLVGTDKRTRLKHVIDKRAIARVEEV